MANKMLIDATHPEETRVVVVRGNRVEEFDFESASRRQLRGNIYLAKVTRVEPSLQAAFVDYGGNRHGFLAFSEIHPDYYQIPVADRQALIAEEQRAERAVEAEIDRRANRAARAGRNRTNRAARGSQETIQSEPVAPETNEGEVRTAEVTSHLAEEPETPIMETDAAIESRERGEASSEEPGEADGETAEPPIPAGEAQAAATEAMSAERGGEEDVASAAPGGGEEVSPAAAQGGTPAARNGNGAETSEEEEVIESVGGEDALEEVSERAPRVRRQYKIQEVIKRRQIMLVQVVKEERGTKGAALTTYLSLAGRYSVLMPNTARGGGISRKITSAQDRKRLKDVVQDLDVPDGMGVILRTAGANRTKAEIKRDFEYLLRLWETVRDLTLKSTAPTLVYEEGSLVKRAIRDLYNKDIDEVLVAGDDAYREAKEFMRMLMPSHAKNVKPYKDNLPIFTRYGVESQLDAMFSPVVQLKSGGYVVVNQAEALVAIDVNSGRATREHHIEDTALKTNLEAAEEIGRQLRLRDLAGLIVIDFIDMDEKRNNRAVERRLKECLKHDRARIQVGRISHFGLLEMSRQRIRTGVLESSTERCMHCGGTGHVRSVGSVTLQLLRSLEEMLLKGATHNLIVRTRADIALYVLNHKRAHLRDLETRFRVTVTVTADPGIGGQPPFIIDRGEQVHSFEAAKSLAAAPPEAVAPEIPAEEEEAELEESEREPRPESEDGDARRRRRRRRGRRGGEAREPVSRELAAERAEALSGPGSAPEAGAPSSEPEAPDESGEEEREARGEGDLRRRRRRGRRGGRRNRRERGREAPFEAEPASSTFEPELVDAIADFGGPIVEAPRPAERAETPASAEERAAPRERERSRETASDVVETGARTQEEAELPRRRSTVREPVAFVIGSGTAPIAPPPIQAAPAGPQPSEAPPEEADQPRRTGWWARRIMGKQG
jgi:ribonuclease E